MDFPQPSRLRDAFPMQVNEALQTNSRVAKTSEALSNELRLPTIFRLIKKSGNCLEDEKHPDSGSRAPRQRTYVPNQLEHFSSLTRRVWLCYSCILAGYGLRFSYGSSIG